MSVFKTDNIDLAAFLMTQGLKYVGSAVEIDTKKNKPKAVMEFLDEKKNARDLERVFITSNEKAFANARKYLLKDAHQSVRDFSSNIINETED